MNKETEPQEERDPINTISIDFIINVEESIEINKIFKYKSIIVVTLHYLMVVEVI